MLAAATNMNMRVLKRSECSPRRASCRARVIFDWCDEYWKSDHPDTQVGGPNRNFLGGAFAGGYADEAGYGVIGSVNQSTYGPNKPNISRTLFKGYDAVKAFYNASSQSGGELYHR